MTSLQSLPPALRDEQSEGLYLYAILDEEAVVAPGWQAALDSIEMLQPVRAAGLVAAVAPVPPVISELAATLECDDSVPGARPGAAVAARLEEAARAHGRAVEHLANCGPILPVRLGTVVRSPSALAEVLEREAQDLHEQLSFVGARREWGLKVWWYESAASTAARRTDAGGVPARSGPGHAYLAARKQQRDEVDTLRTICDEIGRAIESALEQFPSAGCSVGMLASRDASGVAGGRAVKVFAGSFLLEPDEEATFLRRLDAVLSSEAGLEADCSGPWPPYGFVRTDLGSDR